MTLKEIIELRGNKYTPCSCSDFQKGYEEGWKCAYRDLKEILEQNGFDMNVEIKHQKWELKSQIHQLLYDVDEEFYVECPLCKRDYYVPFEFAEEKMLEYARKNYPYCNCGAKMDIE